MLHFATGPLTDWCTGLDDHVCLMHTKLLHDGEGVYPEVKTRPLPGMSEAGFTCGMGQTGVRQYWRTCTNVSCGLPLKCLQFCQAGWLAGCGKHTPDLLFQGLLRVHASPVIQRFYSFLDQSSFLMQQMAT